MVGEFFAEADGIGEFFFALGGGAEPFPLAPDAGAALHASRGGVVAQIAEAGEGEKAEEQDVAEEHEGEKTGESERAFGPLQNAGGKPVAGQKRELREAGFLEELVKDGEDAGFEHFVADGLGTPVKGGEGQSTDGHHEGGDLEGAAIQVAGEVQREPGTGHPGQHDEEQNQQQGDRIKMPGDVARQAERDEQRRDQE